MEAVNQIVNLTDVRKIPETPENVVARVSADATVAPGTTTMAAATLMTTMTRAIAAQVMRIQVMTAPKVAAKMIVLMILVAHRQGHVTSPLGNVDTG